MYRPGGTPPGVGAPALKYLLCCKASETRGLSTANSTVSSFGGFYLILCDLATLNYLQFAECYFSPQTLLMVLSLPGTPFIPFHFINPYSSLKIQLRSLPTSPGQIRYFTLLHISIRVISTLNQFMFISTIRPYALRARTVCCLPLSSQYL